MFNIWRAVKAITWFTGAWFLWHLYHVIFSKKPEEMTAVNDRLLFGAYFVHDSYVGLRDLLTKPPVNSLLLERPPLPPGYQLPKTLVLNVSGTLVHSEYKVSTIQSESELISNYVVCSLDWDLRSSKDQGSVCSCRDLGSNSRLFSSVIWRNR